MFGFVPKHKRLSSSTNSTPQLTVSAANLGRTSISDKSPSDIRQSAPELSGKAQPRIAEDYPKNYGDSKGFMKTAKHSPHANGSERPLRRPSHASGESGYARHFLDSAQTLSQPSYFDRNRMNEDPVGGFSEDAGPQRGDRRMKTVPGSGDACGFNSDDLASDLRAGKSNLKISYVCHGIGYTLENSFEGKNLLDMSMSSVAAPKIPFLPEDTLLEDSPELMQSESVSLSVENAKMSELLNGSRDSLDRLQASLDALGRDASHTFAGKAGTIVSYESILGRSFSRSFGSRARKSSGLPGDEKVETKTVSRDDMYGSSDDARFDGRSSAQIKFAPDGHGRVEDTSLLCSPGSNISFSMHHHPDHIHSGFDLRASKHSSNYILPNLNQKAGADKSNHISAEYDNEENVSWTDNEFRLSGSPKMRTMPSGQIVRQSYSSDAYARSYGDHGSRTTSRPPYLADGSLSKDEHEMPESPRMKMVHSGEIIKDDGNRTSSSHLNSHYGNADINKKDSQDGTLKQEDCCLVESPSMRSAMSGEIVKENAPITSCAHDRHNHFVSSRDMAEAFNAEGSSGLDSPRLKTMPSGEISKIAYSVSGGRARPTSSGNYVNIPHTTMPSGDFGEVSEVFHPSPSRSIKPSDLPSARKLEYENSMGLSERNELSSRDARKNGNRRQSSVDNIRSSVAFLADISATEKKRTQLCMELLRRSPPPQNFMRPVDPIRGTAYKSQNHDLDADEHRSRPNMATRDSRYMHERSDSGSLDRGAPQGREFATGTFNGSIAKMAEMSAHDYPRPFPGKAHSDSRRLDSTSFSRFADSHFFRVSPSSHFMLKFCFRTWAAAVKKKVKSRKKCGCEWCSEPKEVKVLDAEARVAHLLASIIDS